MERRIRNSAKALIIENGKMLVCKIYDNGDTFYIMPGGGQESEELLTDTLKREVAEEIGIEINPKSLEFVIEGVHGENFHRVDFIFLCEYVSDIKDAILLVDQKQIGYEWIDIDELINTPLYPSKLRKEIMKLYYGEKTDRYLGNEEIGDPEYID